MTPPGWLGTGIDVMQADKTVLGRQVSMKEVELVLKGTTGNEVAGPRLKPTTCAATIEDRLPGF